MAPRVSLTMIVKNEEANLPACLASAADLVNEVIVVDTGSTDRTKEVARRFGARIFDFPWIDDFAAARNEALRHATGDWILWLDADDRIDEPNRQKLRALFAGLSDQNLAYALRCISFASSEAGSATEVEHVRLFRRHPQILWQGRIHEQILTAVERVGGRQVSANVAIHHFGYQDPIQRAAQARARPSPVADRAVRAPRRPTDAVSPGLDLEPAGQSAPGIAHPGEIPPGGPAVDGDRPQGIHPGRPLSPRSG